MDKVIVPQPTEMSIEFLDTLFDPEPDPTPCPPPTTDGLAEWAAWYHQVGYRGVENKPYSKHVPQAKHRSQHYEDDDGQRTLAIGVQQGWERTPDANVALRMGGQRNPDINLLCLDADGRKALTFVEKLLPVGTPKCVRPNGDGAKFFLRMGRGVESARLIVKGCKNQGHDGLEMLGQWKTATVPPSVHDTGVAYVWDVPLPDDPAVIPICPDSILTMERVQTKLGVGELAEDMLIRQSGGRTQTVAEWREELIANGHRKVPSVHSPLRPDTKPSCFLYLKNGSLRMFDSAEGRSYRDGVYSQRSGGAQSNSVSTDRITEKFGKTIRICRQYMGLGKDNPLNDYDVVGARMVASKSAVGTGKTTSIADYIKMTTDRLGRPARVLLICHRRSLVGHSVKAYVLLTDYRDIKGTWKDADGSRIDSLGICLDSVCDYSGSGKLASRLVEIDMADLEIIPRIWDVVIMDESESVFRHLHGGTLAGRSYDVFNVLGNILRCHAGQVVLADAHLSDYSIREYRAMVGGDPGRDVLIENTWKRGSAHYVMTGIPTGAKPGEGEPLWATRRVLTAPRLFKFQTPEDVEAMLVHALKKDKSGYVPMTRKTEAKRLHRKLKKLFPTKHIVLVTGEHDDPAGEEFLKDPNSYMTTRKVDALICTQAVESGISIDVGNKAAFDTVFLFGWGDSSTWQDLIQMAGRPRVVNYRWIMAYVPEHGRAPWLNEDDYRKALLEGRDATYGLIKEHLGADGKIKRAPADADHLDSHVRTVVHECRSRRNLGADFWAYWAAQGCEIVDGSDAENVGNGRISEDERKVMQAEKRADKVALKVEHAGEIAATPTNGMTVKEAHRVLDRDHTPDESRRATKVLIADFYGREVIPELVLADDDGRLRQQIRRFNSVRAVSGGDEGIKKVLAAKDEKSAMAGVTATQSNQTIGAILRWQAMQAAGVVHGALNGLPTLGGTVELDGWMDYLKKPSVKRQFKLQLGINVCPAPGRSRKNVTDGSLDKTKEASVTSDGLHHDPFLENLDQEQLGNLIEKAKGEPAGESGQPQPMKLLQDIARQMGLKFMPHQNGKGADRGKRTYRLDPESVKRMLDLGGTDWDRLMQVKVNALAIQDDLNSIMDMLAG